MNLDIDPFEIQNWEEYAKSCGASGEIWRFRKALSDYIYITNRPCYDEIKAYVNMRRGEWARDDLRERKRKMVQGK